MTDESKQLSVAELLARNGQGSSGSGGGGRRRRGGRGISVAELSGDMPVVGGRGSHAAPDPEPEAPEQAAYEAPYEPEPFEAPAYDPAPYAPAAYEPPNFDPVAPEPVSYSPPVPEPELPNYSPMSGPITRYDPLGDPGSAYQPPSAEYQAPDYQQDYQSPVPDYPAPGRSNLVMPGRDMPPATTSRHSAPADSAPYSSDQYGQAPDQYGQAPAPYGQAPDQYGQAAAPYAPAPDAYGRTPDPYGQAPVPYAPAPAPYGQAPDPYAPAPDPYGQAPAPYGQSPDPYGQAPVPYAPAADQYGQAPDPYAYVPPDEPAAEPAALGSGRTGRRRRADPDDDTTDVGPPLRDVGRHDPEPPRAEPGPSRNGRAARRRAQAEEVDTGPWSPPAEEIDTGGWSPGDEDSAPLPLTPLPAPPEQRRAARRDSGLPAWSARRRKPKSDDDAPESGGISTAAWSLASQDQQLVSGSTVAGDLLRDGVERAERRDAERENGSRGRRGRSKRTTEREIDPDDGYTDVHDSYDDDEDEETHSGGFAARLAAGRARFSRRTAEPDTDDDEEHTGGLATRLASRGSRTARRSEHEANRRQWVILGSQSTGAAVAGMLLFKGFERMWEMLPWVALALAMIVILGLVALVRILRRTDDILSTAIAVVVGIFVTLGPLAFLLSTN
ncbi:hypothetical protein [Nocardia sp. XZ_19_385]|uniref:hypothetical protein n=1 Tax=Nocardia sp. XZ_19_385 TaxID=2769488 RepID=UPI001890095B|nr:hypothetical protein [Nocardia sp. XZ_19_385]